MLISSWNVNSVRARIENIKEYLKKISKPDTKIIFDTIRSDYFKKIFKNVEIIKSDLMTVHKSKRIACSQFLD